jgi:hypothetical protein
MVQVEKSLDRKCEAFRKALLAAKATPVSICVDTARLAGGLRAVGAMIQGQQPWGKGKWQYQTPAQKPQQQQFQSPGLTPAPNQGPQTPAPAERREPRITLQTQVTAEWPLHASTAAQLLVEADGIVRRVHEQMLPIIPKKKADNPPPAADNQADEPFAANPAANNSPAPNPGTNNQTGDPFDADEPSGVDNYVPTYVFLGAISPKQLHDAAVRAFKEAVADATAKADIAGYELNKIVYLAVSSPRGDGDYDPFGPSSTPAPEMPGGMLPPSGVGRAAAATRGGAVEVANYDPSSLQYPVSVTVTCHLWPKTAPPPAPPAP